MEIDKPGLKDKFPTDEAKNIKATYLTVCDSMMELSFHPQDPLHDLPHAINTCNNSLTLANLLNVEGAYNKDILTVASISHDIGRRESNDPAIKFTGTRLCKYGATSLFIKKTAEVINQHNGTDEPRLIEGWLLYLGDKLDLTRFDRYQGALNMFISGEINTATVAKATEEVRTKLKTVIGRKDLIEHWFGTESTEKVFELFNERYRDLTEKINFEIEKTNRSKGKDGETMFWTIMSEHVSGLEFV